MIFHTTQIIWSLSLNCCGFRNTTLKQVHCYQERNSPTLCSGCCCKSFLLQSTVNAFSFRNLKVKFSHSRSLIQNQLFMALVAMGETLYASAIISKAIWAGLMGAWQCFKSVLRKHMKHKSYVHRVSRRHRLHPLNPNIMTLPADIYCLNHAWLIFS